MFNQQRKILLTCILLVMAHMICLADLGDVDANGVANLDDAQNIDDFLAGIITLNDEEAADVDLNGSIDSDDSNYIRTSTLIPGDVDGNGILDVDDLIQFINYLLLIPTVIDNINASLNIDNKLDFKDLSNLIRLNFSFVQKRWNGDVNGDYIFDNADALAILQYVNGLNPSSPFDPAYADINNDSIINVLDVAISRQQLLENNCPGNLDGNDCVNSMDLIDLINDFNLNSMIEYNTAKDANEDGAITYADIVTLARIVFLTGDANCDKVVNIIDALITAQYYVKMRPDIPICTQ